jgi:hypothetical protein
LYYLELAGGRGAAAADGAAAGKRSSQVNLTLDFPKDEFRVFVYLSEADAQGIAAKLRNRDVTTALLAARKTYQDGLTAALGGDVQRRVKIVNEALPQEQFAGVGKQLTDLIRERLTKKVIAWVGRAIADHLATRAGELTAAAEAPADGVTIAVTILSPPGAPFVRRMLKGDSSPAQALGDLDSIFKGEPKLAVSTVPGFSFD